MMVICPHCDTRVMPMKDGRCPACRRGLSPDAADSPAEPTREPPKQANRSDKKLSKPQRIGALVGIIVGIILLEILFPHNAGERGFSFSRVLMFGVAGAICACVGAAIGSAFEKKS